MALRSIETRAREEEIELNKFLEGMWGIKTYKQLAPALLVEECPEGKSFNVFPLIFIHPEKENDGSDEFHKWQAQVVGNDENRVVKVSRGYWDLPIVDMGLHHDLFDEYGFDGNEIETDREPSWHFYSDQREIIYRPVELFNAVLLVRRLGRPKGSFLHFLGIFEQKDNHDKTRMYILESEYQGPNVPFDAQRNIGEWLMGKFQEKDKNSRIYPGNTLVQLAAEEASYSPD
jgi:hypothetical protein